MKSTRISIGPLVRDYLAGHGVDAGVVAEVFEERARQDEKWGEQNHPDIPDALKGDRERAAHALGILRAPDAKRATDSAAKAGEVSWLHIAIEELAEALDEAAWGNEDALRTEVVQLAAVCVQWAQAIDRRRAARVQALRDEQSHSEMLGRAHLPGPQL